LAIPLSRRQWTFDLAGKCYLFNYPEEKGPLGRPRRRWVDNVKMDLREIGWDGVDCIDLPQNRDQWRVLVNMVMNFRVP
jgi:hypothetical protein